MTENNNGVNGKLFKRQEPKTAPPTERPPVEDAQQGQNDVPVVEKTTGGSMPVAVETGGAVVLKSETDLINEMFPAEDNYGYGGGRGAEFPALGISKDTQQFMKKDDDGNIKYYSKIRVIIYACSPPNACWLPKDHPRNNTRLDSKFPTCHSLDGMRPVFPGLSESCDPNICEFNEFGSIGKIKPDASGAGKACKNMKVVIAALIGVAENRTDTIPPWTVEDIENVISRNNDIYRIVFPPTSITPFDKYVSNELGQRRGVNMILAVTDITLDKVTQPHTYSVAKFQYAGNIIQEIAQLMKTKGVEVLPKYKAATTLIDKFLQGNISFSRDDVDSPGDPF